MQISLRYLLYLVAWSALCITVFAALRESAVQFGSSLILCGLTLLQLPVHKFGQYGDARDSAIEYFACIVTAGAVGASLIGVGISRLAIYNDGDSGFVEWGDPKIAIGIASGVGILIFFVVIHTVIYILQSKSK